MNKKGYTLPEMVATEVALHYVGMTWLAKFYGVGPMAILRAVRDGRLTAVRIPNARREVILFDKRTIPHTYPYISDEERVARAQRTKQEKKRLRREAA